MSDTTPSRVVVRLPNWLGDAVMALPALAAVRQAFPEAHVALAGLASITPVFEEATPAAQQELITFQKSDEAAKLRAGQFDTAILLTNSFRTGRRAGPAFGRDGATPRVDADSC